MGFILYLLSFLLGIIILPLGLLYGFISCFWKRHFNHGLKTLDTKFYSLAKALDIYGNTVCTELFTATLIKKGSTYPFGNLGETISMVVAANQQESTLTATGRLLAKILIACKDTAFVNSQNK